MKILSKEVEVWVPLVSLRIWLLPGHGGGELQHPQVSPEAAQA